MTIARVRLTLEAKQWLNAPLNPLAKPFLDHISAMLVASMCEGLQQKPQQDGQPR